MKSMPSNRRKKIFSIAAAVCGFPLLNAGAQVVVHETFEGPDLPAGWTIGVAPLTTQYNYTISNGIVLSDADPVEGSNTSILPAAANSRGYVTFRYNLPETVQDFTASMSFSWDNTVGTTQSGTVNANAATPNIYFALYDAGNGIVTRTGIYDNWASGTGGYASLLTGADAINAVSGTAPSVSNGITTINVSRTNGVISINWLDGDGNTLLSQTGNNTTDVSYLLIQFGMYRSTVNPTNTKFGHAIVSEVNFHAIPEPATANLIGISALALGGLLSRKYKKPTTPKIND